MEQSTKTKTRKKNNAAMTITVITGYVNYTISLGYSENFHSFGVLAGIIKEGG